jgi:hypothetical protein
LVHELDLVLLDELEGSFVHEEFVAKWIHIRKPDGRRVLECLDPLIGVEVQLSISRETALAHIISVYLNYRWPPEKIWS